MPQPNPIPGAVRRADEAIRQMTWEENTTPRPAGIIRSFVGEIVVDGKMTWTCIVCAYVDDERKVRFEGAATDLQKGVLLRLPRDLAEIAVRLAETALKIPSCKTGATL